jgi:hypothetical protein
VAKSKVYEVILFPMKLGKSPRRGEPYGRNYNKASTIPIYLEMN